MGPEKSNIGRRDFLQMTGLGPTAAHASPSNQPADSERHCPQPSPQLAPDQTTADIMV
jgi:hypothetical protein